MRSCDENPLLDAASIPGGDEKLPEIMEGARQQLVHALNEGKLLVHCVG